MRIPLTISVFFVESLLSPLTKTEYVFDFGKFGAVRCTPVLFILTLLAFSLLAWLIPKLIKRLDKIKNIPFKKTNKFLGAVFGVIKSVLVIAVLCAVLVFVKDYIFASSQNEFVNQVNSSAIVEFVNKINPLADLL